MPVATNTLAFGDICVDQGPVTKPVLLAVSRSGQGQVYPNNATVTWSVSSSSSNITSPPTGQFRSGNTVLLPADWASRANSTLSAPVTATVTVTPSSVGTASGSVNFTATGGGVTRTASLPWSATVKTCDTTPPTLSLPGPLSAEATNAQGPVVRYTASATDSGTTVPVACTPASGTTFPIGLTTVNCTATDAANNTARGSFDVTVRDTSAPVIGDITAPVVAEATSGSGATVTYDVPTATDAVSGSVPVTCDPASGASFALGETTVTCTAEDARGNRGVKTFTVRVQDTTSPVVVVPDTVVAEATSADGATVGYQVSASDIVDGPLDPRCTPPSGGTFPLGETTVNCSVADAAGNPAENAFTVRVEDTTAPVLTPPASPTVEATSAAGAPATFDVTATDAVGAGPVTCTPASGATFRLGATEVNCSSTDAAGNTGRTSFTVNVVDTTAPALTLPADQLLAATGVNGAPATFAPTATDSVDPNVDVVCTPASGTTFAIGTTRVNCTATDDGGNTATGSFTVKVQRTFSGFYQPVDGARTLNAVKSGSTLPLKFDVLAGSTEMTSTDIFEGLAVREIACGATQPLDDIEQLVSGGTNLRYDTTGQQYIWNWKTPSGAAGKCYQVTVRTTDGASINALFRLR
ncbi:MULTISPECIES: HYR domain-containing protein [unclassified Blastococcus]